MAAGITGCDVFHDDLDQCDLFLEFRYDYNMVNEDWFADQVEEVKVYVFDAEGKYLQTFIEKGNPLKNTDYRMLYGCCMGWKNRRVLPAIVNDHR